MDIKKAQEIRGILNTLDKNKNILKEISRYTFGIKFIENYGEDHERFEQLYITKLEYVKVIKDAFIEKVLQDIEVLENRLKNL